MSSININNLLGNRTVDFDSLRKVANGKYNMGEVELKIGRHGFQFDKVNNHVNNLDENQTYHGNERNTMTNAAVFKAILERYGAIDGADAIRRIANSDLHVNKNLDGKSRSQDVFSCISNPYIREAFKFLMLDEVKGKPLSRDELKLLLNLLDGWEQKASQTAKRVGLKNLANAAKMAEKKGQWLSSSAWMLSPDLKMANSSEIERLKILHTFKATGRMSGTASQNMQLASDVRGMNTDKAQHIASPTFNQRRNNEGSEKVQGRQGENHGNLAEGMNELYGQGGALQDNLDDSFTTDLKESKGQGGALQDNLDDSFTTGSKELKGQGGALQDNLDDSFTTDLKESNNLLEEELRNGGLANEPENSTQAKGAADSNEYHKIEPNDDDNEDLIPQDKNNDSLEEVENELKKDDSQDYEEFEIVKNKRSDPQPVEGGGRFANVETAGVKGNLLIEETEESELDSVEVNDAQQDAKKKDWQMSVVTRLARYAGGESGGRGFMGVDEFGNTVKFLTKWHEGFDVDALTDGDKKCLNKATKRLREDIEKLADSFGDDLKELKDAVISRLPHGLPTKGLDDFIKREAVAQIVNLVADKLTDSKGNKFNWKGVKFAASLSSTTLEKVFDFDYRRNLEKLRAGDTASLKIKNRNRLNHIAANGVVTKPSDTRKVFTSQMLHCLEDADIQKKLADEDLGITEGRDIKPTSEKMTSVKFDYVMGDASKAMATLVEMYPDKKISAMGYGDNTYCACYWKTEDTQEEAAIRSLDPKTPARLKAHGKVKQTVHSNGRTEDVLEYKGNVRSRVSPAMGGVHIDTHLVASEEKPLEEPKPVGIVLGSAPSLTKEYGSRDIIGNLDHMFMFRKDILQDEKTVGIWNDLAPENEKANPAAYKAAEKMQANALKFCEKFWNGAKKVASFKESYESFREVMLMELYYKFDDVDVYADDTDKQVDKLLNRLGELKSKPEEWATAVGLAKENYAKSMVEMYRRLIRLERAKGTEVLLVGPMGCGAFKNLKGDMLDFLAQACVLEGGDMKFVYSAFNEESLPDKEAFESKLRHYADLHGVEQKPAQTA